MSELKRKSGETKQHFIQRREQAKQQVKLKTYCDSLATS